jgi:3-dehydroquinate synthase
MPLLTPGNPYRLDLQLTHDAYPVLIGEDLLAGTAELIRTEAKLTGNRAVVVSDSHVAPLYAETVLKSLTDDGVDAVLITVPAGEASKSMPQVTDVCRGMLQAGLDRKSFLVALGGGVVGDLAGFAAAIFQRGIPYVQIPTTIVSQVDSSVGGKTGVNTPEGKNLVGAFHQPALVLADTATLSTLPDREFHEGFAEIIKHAAIRDASLLDLVSDPQSIRQDLVDLIARNVAIKGRIVEEDEFETSGSRALLNFGHTIGHGVEAAGGYGRFFHGEAISLGLVAATRLSIELAGLDPEAGQRITDCLAAYHLPTFLPEDLATDDILSALAQDKKFESGLIRFVLLRSLGDAFVSKEVTITHLRAAIEGLRRR